MARVIVGSYVVQFPLGGYLSWALQWLVGFQRLGHEVWFVEKSGHADACFDPVARTMSDDCAHGTRVLSELLTRFGLERRWCFVDQRGTYHGVPRPEIEAAFRTCDLFVDMGSHGAWMAEASAAGMRILVDGEPGSTQLRMVAAEATGGVLPAYDRYYTVGLNVGSTGCSVPTAGRSWQGIADPVVPDLFDSTPGSRDAPFTTVMSWKAFEPVRFNGVTYGHKDLEFPKFIEVPRRTGASFEIAVAGRNVPEAALQAAGWRVRDAHAATLSFDAFRDYIAASAGEFSVCKQVFVSTNSGWFSDRSAAYLASGRPVVLQDTGFSQHLPCGEGLLAVRTLDEAAEAVREVRRDYDRHAQAARRIAHDYLRTDVVLGRLLDQTIGQ